MVSVTQQHTQFTSLSHSVHVLLIVLHDKYYFTQLYYSISTAEHTDKRSHIMYMLSYKGLSKVHFSF